MAVMKASLDDLVFRLRLKLADYDSVENGDVLVSAVKEAVSSLSIATECFTKTDRSVAPSGGVCATTETPVNIMSVIQDNVTPPMLIYNLPLTEVWYSEGDLNCWYIENDQIKVIGSFPTVGITYSYIPDLSVPATKVIPERFVPAILAYAEYVIRRAKRDGALAQDALNEFTQLAGLANKIVQKQGTDK